MVGRMGKIYMARTVYFDVADAQTCVQVKLSVCPPAALLDDDAEAHVSLTERLVDAVRTHMRVLLNPIDEDLCALSEKARHMEAQLGEACAREWMHNTLAAYGSDLFALEEEAPSGSKWRLRRV